MKSIILDESTDICCGIGSDGASCMTGKLNGFGQYGQEMVRYARSGTGMYDSIIQIQCLSHHLALDMQKYTHKVEKLVIYWLMQCIIFLFLQVNSDEERIHATPV